MIAKEKNGWVQDFKLLHDMTVPPHRTLLYGPPGTGKTTLALMQMARCEKITLTQGMFPDALTGKFLLRNGSTDWIYAAGSRASKSGVVLVLDEIHKAGVELDSTLQSFMDDPTIARIELDNGETIIPASGYKVIATMNGSPDQLGEAVLDRFDVIIRANTPAPESLKKMRPDCAIFIQNLMLNEPDTDNFTRKVTARTMHTFTALTSRDLQGDKVLPDETAARLVWGENQSDVILMGIMDAARNIQK